MQNLLTDEEWDVSHGRYQTLENIKLFKNAQTLNLTQLKLSTFVIDGRMDFEHWNFVRYQSHWIPLPEIIIFKYFLH